LYDLELQRVKEEIARRGSRRVLLQLPDGLRPHAYHMAAEIRGATGVEVILSGDSCYGACDLASRQAAEVGADLLVHYGHSGMVADGPVPALYVAARVDVDAARLVEACLPHLAGWRRIGLATTVQHVHALPAVASELEARGFEPQIGAGDGVTPHPGQVLGCHYGAAQRVTGDVEGFLFVGGGQFHPLGLMLSTGKAVVAADPYDGSVTARRVEELMGLAKRRYAGVAALRGATRVGIIVSSKPGQRALAAAEDLERRFRERGAEAAIIYVDELRAEHLNDFTEPQAFVAAACPRLALDGVAGLDRPLLTVAEAHVALGLLPWEDAWGRGLLWRPLGF
jgi:2-(3-amino-3-carboxypropyl)histidine synthase